MSSLNASSSKFLYRTGILGGKLAAPQVKIDMRHFDMTGKATSRGTENIQPETEEAAKLVDKWNAVGPNVFTVTSSDV